jgi:hypothetical protein
MIRFKIIGMDILFMMMRIISTDRKEKKLNRVCVPVVTIKIKKKV